MYVQCVRISVYILILLSNNRRDKTNMNNVRNSHVVEVMKCPLLFVGKKMNKQKGEMFT